MDTFSKLMDAIHNLYGDLVEVSELKQTENAVLKKMYLQINFEKFSDLVQFYCILCIHSLICSFFFIFSITILHSLSIVLFVFIHNLIVNQSFIHSIFPHFNHSLHTHIIHSLHTSIKQTINQF